MATYKTYPDDRGQRSFLRKFISLERPVTEAPITMMQKTGTLTFGLLPEEKRSYGSFSVSLIVNSIILAAAIIFTLSRVSVKMAPMQTASLVYVAPPKAVPPPPVFHLQPPPPPPPTPKVETQPVLPPAPVKVQAPKPAPVVHKAQVAPPKPQVVPHVEPKPHVGLFATAVAVTHHVEHEAVHLGSFGATHQAEQNHAQRVAVLGAFGQPATSQAHQQFARVRTASFGSNETNGQTGFHGHVNTAGFGGSTYAGHNNSASAHVAEPSFGGNMYGGHGNRVATSLTETTPIVILAKPLPEYTALARAHHVQGDVLLRVRFAADGRVEVIGVVQSLADGLDQQAIAAAKRIRFKPSTRGGQPVSVVDIIRISFQMT